MKTWKQTFIGLLAILAIGFVTAFAVIACDNGGGKETPKTFIVTFNADNGSTSVTQSVIEGNKATKPENPTKDGNHFDYWFNIANNTEWDFNTIITADLILKAKWNEIQPISKTYDIALKDGALNFKVQYMALPSVAAPEYLTYLQTRLEALIASTAASSISAINYLLTQGNEFTINVEDTETSYAGLLWDNATQAFKVHNDWISAASGTDLTLGMLRDAFNSATIAMLERSNARNAIRLAKCQTVPCA